MSEDLDRVFRTAEATFMEIPLQIQSELTRYSSRKSSTSTSSFEDLNTMKRSHQPGTSKQQSRASTVSLETTNEPENVDGEEIRIAESVMCGRVSQQRTEPKMSSQEFKTTSVGDPSFYASSVKKPPRVHVPVSSSNTQHINEDRDPENVNDIVKIPFEEIFAEPEGSYSFGTIWGASYNVFTDSKVWCYKFLSALCAVPCALCWGMHFACLSFCQIWYFQPCIRSLSVQVLPLSRCYGIIIHSFIVPCFLAFGKLFSSVRVTST